MKLSFCITSASALLFSLASADPRPNAKPIPIPAPIAQTRGKDGSPWSEPTTLPVAFPSLISSAFSSLAAAKSIASAKSISLARSSAWAKATAKGPLPPGWPKPAQPSLPPWAKSSQVITATPWAKAPQGTPSPNIQKPAPKPGSCNCPELKQLSCQGSACECANERAIVCFISLQGKCDIDVKNCASPKEPNNLPTPLMGPFPPCGRQGLASCPAEKICKALEQGSQCPNNTCLGICVPPIGTGGNVPNIFPLQGYYIPLPKQGASQQILPPPPGGRKIIPIPFKGCPQTVACPAPSICVADPRQLENAAAQSLMCLVPYEFCAGFRNDPCAGGKTCMADPRLNCQGEGCTGICV